MCIRIVIVIVMDMVDDQGISPELPMPAERGDLKYCIVNEIELLLCYKDEMMRDE